MLNTNRALSEITRPYTYYVGEDLVSSTNLEVLNKEFPALEMYSREIKEGSQYRKQYNMWRLEVAKKSLEIESKMPLPSAWEELVTDVLSQHFREWLGDNIKVDLTDLDCTVGLYQFGDGDYTTVDTGKLEKMASFGLYLNEQWEETYGGAFEVFMQQDDTEPLASIVPFGGRCVAMQPTNNTWHRIAAVDTGGAVPRQLLMAEFWRRTEQS